MTRGQKILFPLAALAVVGSVSVLSLQIFSNEDVATEPQVTVKKVVRTNHKSDDRELVSSIQDMKFVRYGETNLCIGFIWGGSYRGGPATIKIGCDDAALSKVSILTHQNSSE